MSLTLPDAIARLDAASAAGAVPNRKTKTRGPLARSRRDPIISNVRKALDRALRLANGGRSVPTALAERVDLTPHLLTLPDHGRLAALEDKPHDKKAADKVASNVRLFVSVASGRDVVKDRQPVERRRVVPAYQPLYDVIVEHARKNLKKRRPLVRGYVKWVELATLSGAASPDLVPDDYATIMAWGQRAGCTRKDVHYALNAWRRAVELSGQSYALAWDLVNHRGVGITSLSDWPARLRKAGFSGNLARATAAQLLPYLAPRLARPLETVIARGFSVGLSAAWADGVRDMGSWVVASLIRLGEDASRLTWFDLWTKTTDVEVEADLDLQEQLAEQGIDYDGGRERRSLMRRILDSSAARSYVLSPLWLKNPLHEDDDIPVYTESLQSNLELAFAVTERFFGEQMQKSKPELWVQARADYEATRKHVVAYNKPRKLDGRKPKGSLPITWPQMLCMGLPWLARQCYGLMREVAEREARIGHLESRESQELLNRYCDALFTYAVVALISDDLLRVKNYSGALANRHVSVTPINGAGGRWIGLSEIKTSFSADDDDSVSLKSDKAGEDGGPNERTRRVTPGVVDHFLFSQFWVLARPRALVAAGLLRRVEDFDPRHDAFAVFPTPRPSNRQRSRFEAAEARAAGCDEEVPPPSWRGNMSEESLSDIYGEALHRICVQVLGRDLPAWGSKELTKKFAGIFGAHIARLMAATYLGGVRGRWGDATERTNTEEITLRRRYVRLTQWCKDRMHLDSPEGMQFFDAVLDRVEKKRSGDECRWSQFWELFDPRAPGVALAWLDRAAPGTQERRGRRASRTAA